MAKLPFIEEEVTRQATGFRSSTTGGEAISGALSGLANTAGAISDQIIQKRENDRIMEERASAARFAEQESLFVDELLNGATNSDAINTIDERYNEKFDDRFQNHVTNDLGIESGSERYERMRQYYSRSSAITIGKMLAGGVAKKNATFFLDEGAKTIDARRKAIQANPDLLDATIQEGSVYDGLRTPSGVNQQALGQVKIEEFSSYALDSGAAKIENAATATEIDELREAIFDEDGVYFKNLTADHLDKLDNLLDTRRKGLISKAKAESDPYIKQLLAGHGKRNAAREQQAVEAGKESELEVAINAYDSIRSLAQTGPQGWQDALDEWEAKLNSIEPEQLDQVISVNSVLRQQVNALRKSLNDDPFRHSLTYNEALGEKASQVEDMMRAGDMEGAASLNQELISEVDAYQEGIGLPAHKRGIVSKSHPIYNVMLSAATQGDPESLINTVSTFEALYGDAYSGRAVAELGDDMPDPVLAVMMSGNEFMRTLAASNLNLSNKALNDSVERRGGRLFDGTTVDKEFDAAAQEFTQDIYSAHENEFGGTARAARFSDIMIRQAKTLMAGGIADTPEKAMKMAYQDMFADKITYTPTVGGAVRIPNEPTIEPEMVRTGLNTFHSASSLIGVEIAPIPAGGALAGLTPEQQLNMTKDLLKTAPVYTTTKDNSGVMVNVRVGAELAPVRDTEGNHIFLAWDDIQSLGMSFLQERESSRRERLERRGSGAR